MSIPMRSTLHDGFVDTFKGSRFSVELISSYGEGDEATVASLSFIDSRSEARKIASTSLGVPANVFYDQDNVNVSEHVDSTHPAWAGHIMTVNIIANNGEDINGDYARETLQLQH